MFTCTDDSQVELTLAQGLRHLDPAGKKILMIVPDTTRTAPVARLVKHAYAVLSDSNAHLDVLIALGTHPPLTRDTLLAHLGMTEESYSNHYSSIRLLQHNCGESFSLTAIGNIRKSQIEEITEGLLSEDVKVTINSVIFEYDEIIIVGPVFPHEVAGFSGGSKYLFPGVAGPEMIDFFHWLGALITNLRIIGTIDNPVRRVLDEAAKLVPIRTTAVSLVMRDSEVAAMYIGPLELSWRAGAQRSAQEHIVRKPRLFHKVLSCSPPMYQDMWTAGKCMYKCEPVVADGGELIIYAPHVSSLSHAHGQTMEKIGYHVRDYFLKQPKLLATIPRVAAAVSTFLKGSGTFENGAEKPRITVTLATSIPKHICEKVGLKYTNPDSINPDDWKNREEEGILFVEKAGETLFLPENKEVRTP